LNFSIRYFKEYYHLKGPYQDIAQMTGGFGLVSGIFIYWFGWGSLLGLLIGGQADGSPRQFAAWESFLVVIGLPLSLWLGIIGVALLFALLKKISLADAVSLGVKFSYPRHWLKASGKADTPQPTRFNADQD